MSIERTVNLGAETVTYYRRAIGTCRSCGRTLRLDGEYGYTHRHACGCGQLVQVTQVTGREQPQRKCDDRCLNAKRSTCDCSCGGKNHGAGI